MPLRKPLAHLSKFSPTWLQKQQGQKITEGWTDAVTAFIQNHPSWEGGDFNRDVLKNIISENGWDDAEDKLSALEAAAYEYAS